MDITAPLAALRTFRGGPIGAGICIAFFVFSAISLVVTIRNWPRDNPLEGFDVEDPSNPPDPGREAGG